MEATMDIVATAVISALTSAVVVVISHALSVRGEIKKAERADRQAVNSRHLNPLRPYLSAQHRPE